MSEVTTTEEVVPETTPVVEETPPQPTEETPITEQDIQDLIDRVMAEPATPPIEEKKEEPIPTSPQFVGEKDPLTETIEQLDQLVEQTVALEQEKNEVVEKVSTLEQEITTLQAKVDFVDTAFERISEVIGADLATQIAQGTLNDVPKYLIPGNMEKVLSDKILGPLVTKALEGQPLDIPKFLGEIVASKKAALPNITSDPPPVPKTVNPKESLMSEVTRLSNLGF